MAAPASPNLSPLASPVISPSASSSAEEHSRHSPAAPATAAAGADAGDGAATSAPGALGPPTGPLLWVPAVTIVPTHLKRRVCVAYSLTTTHGRVLYSRDVPKNQPAASRAYNGLRLAAKKERLCGSPPQRQTAGMVTRGGGGSSGGSGGSGVSVSSSAVGLTIV